MVDGGAACCLGVNLSRSAVFAVRQSPRHNFRPMLAKFAEVISRGYLRCANHIP